MRDFDMLAKLYDLPQPRLPDQKVKDARVRIHRPMPFDREKVSMYIREKFGNSWALEFEKAMCNTPVSCFIAVTEDKQTVGFACYDATCRGFFGPIGVSEEYRGKHVGRELLLSCLCAMREAGSGYAVIGWVSEENAPFYRNACGALEIPDSFPGVYRDSLAKINVD